MVCEALRNNDGAFYSRTTTVDSELIEKMNSLAKEEVRSFVGLCVDAPDNEVVMNVLDSCLNNSARETSIQLNSFDFNTKLFLFEMHMLCQAFGAHVRESINYSGCYDMCAIFGFYYFLSSTETIRKKIRRTKFEFNDQLLQIATTFHAAVKQLAENALQRHTTSTGGLQEKFNLTVCHALLWTRRAVGDAVYHDAMGPERVARVRPLDRPESATVVINETIPAGTEQSVFLGRWLRRTAARPPSGRCVFVAALLRASASVACGAVGAAATGLLQLRRDRASDPCASSLALFFFFPCNSFQVVFFVVFLHVGDARWKLRRLFVVIDAPLVTVAVVYTGWVPPLW
eukprot:gene9229-6482_t